jgi:hypothetical protein
MAIAVEMEFAGATIEQYDQVIEKMGFAHDGPGAPGGLFHWVAKTDRGLRVVDVWESRETFDRFAQEQILPYTQEAGIGTPELTFYEVYNTLTAPVPVSA